MRRSKGFSLLEVIIATAILGFVMAALYASLYSGTQEYEVNNRRAYAVEQARLALDQLSEDIRQGARMTMQPPPPGVPNAPAESAATNNISFYKALAPVGGVAQKTPSYVTYMWVQSGAATVTSPVDATQVNVPLSGSTWIDANGNNVNDDGMLVRIDPNPVTILVAGVPTPESFKPRILCNYLKNDPNGFKVTQSLVTVNSERMLQIHITLTVCFTDSKNRVLEQTLESKVFVRNLQ